MIWASRFGKVFVVVASVGMHGLAAYLWWSEPDVQTEGGAVQARVGSFADMTAGTMSAVTPETLEEVEPTETTETATSETEVETPVDKTEAGIEPPVEQPETRPVAATAIQQSDPQPTEADAPTEDLVAPELPVEATPSETALALAPAVSDPDRADLAAPVESAPVEAAEPLEPVMLTSERVEPEITKVLRAEPIVTAAAPPPETLQALPEIGVQVSPRPEVRPQRIEDEAQQRRALEQQQRQQREPKPAPREKQGRAPQNTRAGAVDGSDQGQASQQSTTSGRSTAAGNAAANNYPGLVWRKLSRVPRPNVGSRGTVVVSFLIGPNGGLNGVSVVRSSGSARLDQAALQVVRRAAPFPRPPAGAQRSFQISIEGRV